MKKNTSLIAMIVLLIGCQANQPLETSVPFLTAPSPTTTTSLWGVYDPDPAHPWNRFFRQLYRRMTSNGEEFGAVELDPLLWIDTTHLLAGDSHQQAIRVLDEFLTSHAENLIRDPLRRAMFQRDLWAVFDWLASQAEVYPVQRRALETRLAQIMKRVALSKEEILSLPDNYSLAIASKTYPTDFSSDSPEEPFLPDELFQSDSAWIPLGREGGTVAITHTEAFPFFGHSVFLVFLRSPEDRVATLRFIESLNADPDIITPSGSEVALVRRMLLIDDQGDLVLSPLVETIQIRHFNPLQTFYEFELDRARLFDTSTGGLIPNHDLFMLFMSHGDVFENHDIPDLQATIPDICKGCHFHDPSIPNAGNTHSIISFSRDPFPLPDHQQPVLFATTVVEEAQTVIEWKRKHATWSSLEALWGQASP